MKVSMQKGQIILVLILIMGVGLAIGLSVIQRSLTDINTSSNLEQSSRAFSAAEAGIERALRQSPGPNFNLSLGENNSNVNVSDSGLLPAPVVSTDGIQAAFARLDLNKEDVAEVWLANPADTSAVPANYYNPPTNNIDIYWGNSATDQAAIQITIIAGNGPFSNMKYFYDPSSSRITANNFTLPDCSGGFNIPTISGTITFRCRQTVTWAANSNPKILRARLLYNNSSQPFAARAVGSCASCFLPPQARIITSIGSSGGTQRRVQLFKQDNIVPLYFDYAIFSEGEIIK